MALRLLAFGNRAINISIKTPRRTTTSIQTSSIPPLLCSKPFNTFAGKMSWSCQKCTFINPSSSNSVCQVCLSPISPPCALSSSSNKPSSESPRWSCKACTFLNSFKNSDCVICGTRSPPSFFDDTSLDSHLDPSVGSVFLPLRSCKRKVSNGSPEPGHSPSSKKPRPSKDCGDGDRLELGRVRVLDEANSVTVLKDDVDLPKTGSSLKVLSYNVWFREDLELQNRMRAIGSLIQLYSPDIICLQEVTPDIYDIFQRSNWWKTYRCSLSSAAASSSAYFCMQLSKLPVKSFNIRPFSNSIMGRELCTAELKVDGNKPLVVATSHLESPCPGPPKWDQMFSKERVVQANEAIDFLKENPNVIFCGDMNWDDKLDGQFPLPSGWVDVWTELKAGDNGYTYDTKSNQMLTGNRTLQKRLDRFLCNLRDFKVSSIEMVGKEAIPGLSYTKEKKVRHEVKKLELPVLPSDHYGLLLTLSAR
ncbi:Tyrosyl-DNA phosphodiesterase 2 [Linum perenne]